MYLSWFSDVVPGNIILRDGWRGSRLYANNAIINFALLNQLYALKMRKSTLLNIFLLLLTITAVWFSQSRMSTLFCLITLCAYLFVNPLNSFRLIRMFCYVYVPISILAIANSNRIGEFLAWLDPESLSLRILNLTAAQEFFAKNPILGMGIQGSSDFYYSYLGYPYFPEDLGGIGLASTFGLLGLLVFFALLLLALQGMKRAIASQDAQLLVVVHSGYFVILLSFVWPTLFYGDGSIVVSLLIALYICYRRDARKLYQRASIKAGVPNHAGRWI
jgi:hypothetical protein